MDTTSLVWIIVGIIVVVVIVGVIIYFARQRNRDRLQKQRAADKRQAAELRQNAEKVELDARENEARATRARADAAQAEVDAERLRRESAQREADAQDLRTNSNEQARQAEKLDPAGDDSRTRGDTAGTPRTTGATQPADYPGDQNIRGEDTSGNLRDEQPKPREEDYPQSDGVGGRDR